MIQAPNMQNTAMDMSESHQASGQVSATSGANRTTKYSPNMRSTKPEASGKQAAAHFGGAEYHVPSKNLHKVNYLH